jgi:RNA polymerase sigma-70 factor (ECF subfamily)
MLLRLQDRAEDFYPYHVARADMLRRTNQREAAVEAYRRAVELCGNSAERAFLERQRDEVLGHN